MKHPSRLLVGALIGLACLVLNVQAASTDIWLGGSGNNFSTTGNWTYSSGAGPVATTDTLVFGGAGSTTPNNDETGFTFNNIGFSNTVAYTVGGNDFTLGSGGSITNGGAVTQTINNKIALTGSGGTISPSVASSAITLGGVISGSANLTKSGNSSGTLTLSGINTFSGTLTFNAGTVVFTTPPNPSGANLGNPSGITFGGSSTTTLVTTPGAGSITISYPTITANASSTALFKNGGAAGTTYEISAKITGAGNCKQNTPTTTGAIVRFSNDTSDYTGNFTMAGGIVEFTSVANASSPAALGGKGTTAYAVANSTTAATLRYVGSGNTSTTRNIDWQGTTGSLTLDNTNTGTVQFLGSGNLKSGSGAAGLTLRGSNTGANTLGQVISDVGGATTVTKSDAGTWVLSGANSYSGGTTVGAGTLQISGSGTLGSSAGALSLTGATLDLGGTSQTQGAVTISGASTLTNGTLTGSSFSATPASGITATLYANLAGSTAPVSHTGAGTVALLGTNSYNGGTTVGGGGVLIYNSIAASGSSCALGQSSVLDVKNGTYQYFGPTATNSRTFQFSTLSGTPVWNVDNALTNTTLTLTADFMGGTNGGAAGARTIGLNVNCTSDSGSASTLKMLGAVPDVTPTNSTTVVAGGATGYTVFNGGTVGLLGLSNTFSGAVQIKYSRTLQAMSLADSNTPCSIGLGTNPPAGSAPIIIGSTDSMRGGTLAYVGTNNASCNRQLCVEGVNFGGQSSAAIVNNSPNNSGLHLSCTQPVIYFSGVLVSNCFYTLGGSANAANIFDLQITNTPLGSAALTVSGSTWLLTAPHTYTGNTIVSGGTLLVNGSIGGNAVTNTGGTLGGTGTINSPVTIQSGGTLRAGPGAGSIGTLTVNNILSLAGKAVMQLNRTNAQTADLVTGLSTINYGGTLTVTNIGDPFQAGDAFTLFTAANYGSSAFAATNLPPLADNLVWDTSQLGVNGTISVGQLPTLTPGPVSQTVECSGSATFTAAGAGLPAPAFQWSVNGSPVSGATDATFTTNNVHEAGSVYTITLTATNTYGSVSSNATLTVQDTTPPVVTQCVPAQTLATGSDCTASLPDLRSLLQASDACSAGLNVVQVPPPGTALSLGPTTVAFLVDDGNGNTNTTCSTTVTVQDQSAPNISGQPLSVTNHVGTPASFTVTVAACSALSYQWRLNQAALGGKTDSTLSFASVGSCDAGSYDVIANSAGGSSTSQVAVLTVINDPASISPAGPLAIGTQSECGGIIFNAGGAYTWEMNDVNAGAGVGWDLLSVSGGVDLEASPANPFTVKLVSLAGVVAGAVTNFDNDTNYTWSIAAVTGSVTNFDAGAFLLDSASFSNDLAGGTFALQSAPAGLSVAFSNNHPPTADDVTIGRAKDTPIKIAIADLLAGSTADADGDARVLLSAGPALYGTVTTNDTFIFFTPADNRTDSFTYLVGDVRSYRPGDSQRTAQNTITIEVTNSVSEVQNIVVSGNSVVLNLAGIPDDAYDIQRTTNLTIGAWVTLVTTNAPPAGVFQWTDSFQDLGAVPPAAFYRLRQH